MICKHCKKEVTSKYDIEWFDVLENMHWKCFHMVFEHYEPNDVPCDDLRCPVGHSLYLFFKLM